MGGHSSAYRSGYSEFHGASVRLCVDLCGNISHENQSAPPSIPTVRSYSDGIRVGCTFVTTEALAQVQKWHKEFLESKSGLHQMAQKEG